MLTWVGVALALFFILCACGLVLSAATRGKYPMLSLAVFSTACSLAMMFAAAVALASGRSFEATLWNLEGMGPLKLRLDMLSAVFLFVSGMVYLPASLFVRKFIEERFGERYPMRRYGVLHFALMASIVLILTASDALSFLISWECMSIFCYLLVNHGEDEAADSGAGYIMLAMSEAGFLAVVVAFLILGRAAPDWSFPALGVAAKNLSGGAVWSVFLLGFLGFGVKAGLVPVNFWLPRCIQRPRRLSFRCWRVSH